jgi:hypothetical protein
MHILSCLLVVFVRFVVSLSERVNGGVEDAITTPLGRVDSVWTRGGYPPVSAVYLAAASRAIAR